MTEKGLNPFLIRSQLRTQCKFALRCSIPRLNPFLIRSQLRTPDMSPQYVRTRESQSLLNQVSA